MTDTTFKLQRTDKFDDRTLGKLFQPNGMIMGEILEDRIRSDGEYIYGETAIPAGKYRMIISFSNRFKKRMIQLINVRGGNIQFGKRPIDQCGVRIHGGNDIKDTLGCPLLGKHRKKNEADTWIVYDCKEVNDQLLSMVDELDKTQEVYLEVFNPAA